MIRRATLDDIGEAVAVALEFHAQSVHVGIPADPEALAVFMAKLIEHGAVFLSAHGIVGGMLSPVYFNPAYVIAAELFWWAPQDGRALREAFEAWAKDSGAHEIQFTGQHNERVGTITRLFERAGYRAAEVVYLKRI
jgi:hypothetical protein